MWFGHGTSADKNKQPAPDSSVVGKSTADRVLALAYGAIASLPAAQRRQAEAQYHNSTLPRLKEAMTAWLCATALDQTTFASRLFGRAADDPIVRDLHRAALGAATATSQNDLWDAAEKVAKAMQAVGIDRWPRFVADAAERARDPATQAAIEKSRRPPDPARDAIRPVYPLETLLLGMGARGAVGAARAAGGALLKQLLPEKGSEGSQSTQNSPQTTESTVGKPNWLLLGSGVVMGPSRNQARDERAEQGFAAPASVVHELEEAEIKRQLVLRDAAVRAQPGAQQGPKALDRVGVDLAEPVTVLVAGVFAASMADRLVSVAPGGQARVDAILVRVDEGARGDRCLDDRLDRPLLHVGQHAQHHLAAALDQAEDGRLVLLQRAAARRACQPAPPSEPPLLATAAGWPLCPATT